MSTAEPSVNPKPRLLRVFLCHSSGDKRAVRDLYHRLKADGFSPWLDEEDLLPGQDWQVEIPAAVRACDVVVVCLSQKSIGKEGYLQREIRFALDAADEKPEGTIFIIPVRLEEVEVPRRLSQWQWANLFEQEGYGRLLRALNKRGDTLGVAAASLAGVTPRKSEVVAIAGTEAPAIPHRISAQTKPRGAELRPRWSWLGSTPLFLRAYASPVDRLAVTPDGRWLISASRADRLKVWELATGFVLRTLQDSRYEDCWAVMPDGKHAVSAKSGSLTVWDLDSGQKLRTLPGHSGNWIQCLAVTLDGKRAVSASDETLTVWDLDAGVQLHFLEGHTSPVCSVALTPDGRRAVSGSLDNTLKVWDVDTAAELHTLKGHSGSVQRVAVTPDGRRAISASSDQTLKVWDLHTGAELHSLEGKAGELRDLALTPDGRQVISVACDDNVRIWDLETGQLIATLTCKSPECCACSSSGTIIVGTSNGLLYLFKPTN